MAKVFIATDGADIAYTGSTLEEVYGYAVEDNGCDVNELTFYEAEEIEVEVKVVKKSVPIKAPANQKSK